MSRPWMPLYVADYLADTAHLSAAEHGAYLLLIMHYWTKGKLPDDEDAIRRITRLTARQWSQSRDVLRSLFGDQWRHKRIDDELGKAIEKSKVNSANAKRSHDVRTANAERTHTQSQSQSQSPIDVADEERAGDLVTPEAFVLSDKLLVIAGHDPKFTPPGWCGAPMRVQTWLTQGWKPEIIVAAVQRVVAKARGRPINSVQFFENAIAEEVARQAAPLPVVEIKPADKLTVTHGTSNDRSGGSLTASIRRELAELEQSEGADFALPASSILRISR